VKNCLGNFELRPEKLSELCAFAGNTVNQKIFSRKGAEFAKKKNFYIDCILKLQLEIRLKRM